MDTETRNALVMDNMGCWATVVRNLRRRLSGLRKQDFEELMQEAVCKLLSAAQSWDGRRNFLTYGGVVLERHFLGFAFRDRLMPLPVPGKQNTPGMIEARDAHAAAKYGPGALERLVAPGESPKAPGVARIRVGMLLKRLPPHRADYLRDHYGIGRPQLTIAEMAAREGLDRRTAGSRVAKAVAAIRRRAA